METLDEVIPYVPDISLPKAIIVDVDGTVALWRAVKLQCFQVSDGNYWEV